MQMPQDLTGTQNNAQPICTTRSVAAGAVLLAATLLEVLAMAHHPSVHTPDVATAIERIARLATLDGWVHGVVLSAMLAIAYGLFEFTLRRGALRPWMRAGSLAYGAGVIIMMGAGLVSGFILPGLIASTPHVSATDLAGCAQMLILCRELNQSCANAATVAISAGIVFWSIDLLRERGLLRALGLLGLLAGLLPAAALISGSLRLDVHGMSEVVWLQALWNGAIAIALIRSTDIQARTV
jgi:hypothetical protein